MTLFSRRIFLTTIAAGCLPQLTWQHGIVSRTADSVPGKPSRQAVAQAANASSGSSSHVCPKNSSNQPKITDRKYWALLEDFPQALKYLDHVETHARDTGLDPLLVMAVIRQESLFGHFLVSDIGAVGVMQIIPPTARSLGMKTLIYPSDYDRLLVSFLHGSSGARRSAARKLKSYARTLRRGYKRSQGEMTALDERFDTGRNIQAGCRYLAKLEQRLGSIDLALAGYYAGPTAIRRGLSRPVRRYVAEVKDFYQNYI